MRTATSTRLLLATAALVLAACEDSDSPFEAPETPEAATPEMEAPGALADARWADGYAVSDLTSAKVYSPAPEYSYNRAGGKITIQQLASTGRYTVTFTGLSARLGARSTVHVTAASETNTHCKPVAGVLAADKVEIRCTDIRTGSPVNTVFTVLVLGKAAGRAFAYANQPTTTSYAPAGSGSHNPAGSVRVSRLFTGNYNVVFNGLGARLGGKSGHVQVHAVGTGKAWCKTAEEWQGNPNLGILVQCYTTGGLPVDSKFTVLFQLPAAHLAYAYAYQQETGSYVVDPYWSSNPSGGQVRVNRIGRGMHNVTFEGVDPQIIDLGNTQVTALGLYSNANCVLFQLNTDGARVHCYAANGTPVDEPFTIQLGS